VVDARDHTGPPEDTASPTQPLRVRFPTMAVEDEGLSKYHANQNEWHSPWLLKPCKKVPGEPRVTPAVTGDQQMEPTGETIKCKRGASDSAEKDKKRVKSLTTPFSSSVGK
jgi:hypothetical protein